MTGLKAIAAEAGVALSTVSFVLNGRGGAVRISEATQSRVLEAARRLGYAPNVSRSATTGGAPECGRPCAGDPGANRFTPLPDWPRGAWRTRCTGGGIGGGPGAADRDLCTGAAAQHRSLQSNHRIHGAIVLNVTPADEAFLEEADPAVPVVLFQRTSRHNYVQLDNTVSGRVVAEHLSGLGHRHFGVLVPNVQSSGDSRTPGELQKYATRGRDTVRTGNASLGALQRSGRRRSTQGTAGKNGRRCEQRGQRSHGRVRAE